MARLYFIRHGEAAAGFGEDHDPGLSTLGQEQSQKAADAMMETLDKTGPIPIISSPLKRCQETATPLCRAWERQPTINRGVSEIPSPMEDLSKRSEWLGGIMRGTWSQADEASQEWRDYVVETAKGITQDTVVFSHYVAINVIAGNALGDDRVVCFRPDNCSITVIDVVDGDLKMVKLGGEAVTHVN
jgi:broad specificity phosphatase PhoE